jgi:hypothetical protein
MPVDMAAGQVSKRSVRRAKNERRYEIQALQQYREEATD